MKPECDIILRSMHIIPDSQMRKCKHYITQYIFMTKSAYKKHQHK